MLEVIFSEKEEQGPKEEFALTVSSCGTKTATFGTLRELLRRKRDNKTREAATPKLNPEKSLLLCDRNGSEKATLFTEKRTCMLLLRTKIETRVYIKG